MNAGRGSGFGRGAGALAAWLLVVCLPGVAAAGIAQSKHNFSSLGVSGGKGVCNSCHISHGGGDVLVLWNRDLSQERAYFNQTANPNYVGGATLLCYDCHDNHSAVDNDPPDASFATGRWPQDAAFDPDMKNAVPPPRDSSDSDNLPGYYENIPSGTAGSGSTLISGHFVTSDPGIGTIAQGDKLPCDDCHNPHTSANQAFIRTDIGGKTLTGVKASTNMTFDQATRDDVDSRRICIACHGTSDGGGAVTFGDVNPGYGIATIVAPPDSVGVVHRSAGTTACVVCHTHNRIKASCSECHGFPPLVATTFDPVTNKSGQSAAYSGSAGAGAHQRHIDALGLAIFDCQICHGENAGSAAWHNETGTGVVAQGNVDIRGMTSYWGAGSSYNGDGDGGAGAYAFAAKGGMDGGNGGRCANLLCHGLPPDTAGALNWTDDMVDETGGDPVAADSISICKWCHDATPARIGTGPVAPNVLGTDTGATGVWTTGTWGADVSGHGKAAGVYDANAVGGGGGLAAANRQCAVCHDARYKSDGTPYKTHFDNANDSAQKRLKGTDSTLINGLAAADADAVCVNCHQNGATGTGPEGTEVSTHGNGFARKQEGDFTRSCRQCHEVHGANWNGLSGAAPNLGRNLHMVGSWVDADNDGVADAGEEARVDSDATTASKEITTADNAVVFTGITGTNSYDENDGVYNPADDTDDICATCHIAATGPPPAGTGGGSHAGTPDSPGDWRGQDCMMCHDVMEHPHDFDGAVATADAFMPSGCFSCHGSSVTKQFWPDGVGGVPTYSDDNAGVHENHVLAISQRVFGETIAQLLADANSTEKQKQICRYCHPDPGGSGHTTDSGDQRVDIVAAGAFGKFTVGAEPLPPAAPTADTTSLAYTPGAVTEGICNNLVCHNQAASPSFWNNPPFWVALPPNPQCSNVSCHATGTYSVAHAAHAVSRTEGTGAGSGYLCTECHVDNGIDLQHQNGEVDMLFTNAGSLDVTRGGATVAYYDKDNSGAASVGDTGFAYKDTTSGYAKSCNNVYCHGADSTWGGADTTPVWNDPATATCYQASTCHNAYGSPYDQYGGARFAIASGSHAVHFTQWTSASGVEAANPRGPRLAVHPNTLAGSTQPNCSVCHNLQPPPGETCATTDYCHLGTGSGASLPTPTHADGSVDFIGTISGTYPNVTISAESLANTTACNPCHGGATPAATAKSNWNTPAWRAPCEECHGDYTAARSRPNIGPPFASVDAPTRAGTAFDGSGHGKLATPNPTYGGKLCVDCHAENSQHFTQRDGDGTATIAPVLGDTNRLDVLGGNDYAVAPIAYCGTCHSGFVETVHFDNTNTAGGTSDPGILCSGCHDPHGQAGQDAMIVGSVPVGGTISGFTDKSARASYANATFQGVCQACHDAAEVTTFNRATDSSATHESGVCTSCHIHSNAVAFSARCYDCHGDFLTETYAYPDSGAGGNPNTGWPNRAGRHAAHVTAIANFSPSDGIVANDQSACVWCHPGGGHSGDHAASPADLMNGSATHFLTINGLTDSGELVTQAAGNVACAGVNCHYNEEMPAADWYGAPSVTCAYCHTDGVADYTAADLPNAHDRHVGEAADGGRDLACVQCHPLQTSNTHQNGTIDIAFDATNTLGEPGVTLATATGSDSAVKYGQTGGGFLYATCNFLFCHGADRYEDASGLQLGGGTLTAPRWDLAADCGTCHDTGTQAGETSPITSIATGNHAAHLTAAYGPNLDETQLNASCDQCHPAYPAIPPYRATHVDGTVNFLNLDNTTVTTLALTDTCAECHGASVTSAKTPANWANGSYLLPCIECHDAANPANSARAGTGVNAPAKDATLWSGRGHGNTTTFPWGTGRAGANSACPDCHAPASAHLSGTLADGDRLSTAGNALCKGCHDGSGGGAATTSVSSHGNRTTMTPTYTAQRSPFELNCVECHDVHGTTNIYMVNTANPDGPLVAERWYNNVQGDFTTFLFRGTVAFTDHSVGTSSTSGVGFADTNALGNASKICQTCHTATVHFQYNSTDTHFNSICVGCHPHEFDSNNATEDAFMPKGDCKTCHDAAASNPPPLAPKVMASWTTSGHGKAGIAAECTDCHTLSLPVPDTHLNDTVNSVWENGTVSTRNTNTAHLRAEFFTPYTGNGASGNDWDIQVSFDNRCWAQCHNTAGASDHRHYLGDSGAHDYLSVQFGRLNAEGAPKSVVDGDRGSGIWMPSDWTAGSDTANAPYPIDCDLSTDADCSDTDYAPCISCHDPHGTDIVQPGVTGGNRMLRRKWKAPSSLCRGCHL